MDSKEFVIALEQYFGEYKNPVIKTVISDYYAKTNPKDLEMLYKLVLVHFKAIYGTQPDLASIEEIKKKYWKEVGEMTGNYETPDGEVYRNGVMIGHYDGDRFIPALYLLKDDAKKLEYKENYTDYSNPSSFAKLVFEDLPPAIEDKTEDGNKEVVKSILSGLAKGKEV